jgi:hypothetical protein
MGSHLPRPAGPGRSRCRSTSEGPGDFRARGRPSRRSRRNRPHVAVRTTHRHPRSAPLGRFGARGLRRHRGGHGSHDRGRHWQGRSAQGHRLVLRATTGIAGSRLEWLKTPPKRHSPSTMAETLEKIRALKELGVHGWPLDGVALSKQQAYAAHVQMRRPSMTARIERQRQTVEITCFLRVTLLELTDMALLQASRRSQDLFRRAAERVEKGRSRSSGAVLQQALRRSRCFRTSPSPGAIACSKLAPCWTTSARLAPALSHPRSVGRWPRTTGAFMPTWQAFATSSLPARQATPATTNGRPGSVCKRTAPRRFRRTSICRLWARRGA